MESGQITAIILASIICGTITVGVVVQAWVSSRARGVGGGSAGPRLDALEERMERLEQAIDSVAIEVERGSEAQRFTARLLAERLRAPTADHAGARGQED